MYLVSACLAGLRTRYDLGTRTEERVVRMVREGRAIPICPEQLAGLPTPRPPAEFKGCSSADVIGGGGLVARQDGTDVTAHMLEAARLVLGAAKRFNVESAVFKDGSPSCGVTYVYCDGQRTPGTGVTTELLIRNGIRVIDADSI